MVGISGQGGLKGDPTLYMPTITTLDFFFFEGAE
jgi:hypothetical protein